jgi:glutamate mutase epsilon subunit
MRDLQGAIRIYDFGNLPVSDAIRTWHRQKLWGREPVDSVFDAVMADINHFNDEGESGS